MCAELHFVSYWLFSNETCICSIFSEMTLVLHCGMFDTITKKAKSVYWLAVKECWIPWMVNIDTELCICEVNVNEIFS